MLRTHTCGELGSKDLGSKVILCGWVHSRRDHGGVIFIDLRDRYGLTQAVFDPSHDEKPHKTAEHLGREYVISVEGKIRKRKEGMINPKLKTGEVELLVDNVQILSKAKVPPIEIDDEIVANEDLRLKYRYLDLRRPVMQKHLEIRHRAAKATREFLNSRGFLEIETPMLVKSTPEGARDYIVPSRITHGNAYALPQSPQLYKQILMISGCDKYYQIARCLRDEDLRADRQPEFTQIDIEMSFITEEDIYELCEGMMKKIFKDSINYDVKTPFQRISYDEARKKYGTDKPDIRFGFELVDATGAVKNCDFSVFKQVIEKNGVILCVNAKNCANFSRKELDELIEKAESYGASGLAWMKVSDGKLESNIVKYFSKEIQENLMKKMDAKNNDLLLFVADRRKTAEDVLGLLRKDIANKLGLIKKDVFQFLWVTDFPSFEYNEAEDRIEPSHHMFTMPKSEDLIWLEKEPLKVRARCYDLVLNGIEIASGSIRNHDTELQKRVMKVIGLSEEEAMEKFGFLLEALQYGAPPHGGIAPGFDRIVALMCGFNDIREVIAFPKNKKAECPMDGSPSAISEKQLKELGLKFDFVRKT